MLSSRQDSDVEYRIVAWEGEMNECTKRVMDIVEPELFHYSRG